MEPSLDSCCVCAVDHYAIMPLKSCPQGVYSLEGDKISTYSVICHRRWNVVGTQKGIYTVLSLSTRPRAGFCAFHTVFCVALPTVFYCVYFADGETGRKVR